MNEPGQTYVFEENGRISHGYYPESIDPPHGAIAIAALWKEAREMRELIKSIRGNAHMMFCTTTMQWRQISEICRRSEMPAPPQACA